MQAVTVLCADCQSPVWSDWSGCGYTDEIAVFRSRLPKVMPERAWFAASLLPDELARANRYRQEKDRNRFLIARAILRILAGNYLKQSPVAVQFKLGMNNKPDLADGKGWHVNVSHTGEWVLVSVSKAPVGVDVEYVDPNFSFSEMLTQTFSEAEQQFIHSANDSRTAFYQLWTRKEALVKATAKGIDDDFNRVPSLNGLHQVGNALPGSPANWTVAGFPVSEGYPAAVAHQFPGETIKFYTVESGLLVTDQS